ncbi:hypothetical protein Saga11_01550 [Bacillus safensis]|nr:hypothetical protein Saga11_01550 [Bacillus safensis]
MINKKYLPEHGTCFFFIGSKVPEDFLKIKKVRREIGNFGVKYKIGHEPIGIDNSDEVKPIEI